MLPLIDVLVVITRRIAQHRSPLFGDRSHLYDKVAALGHAPRDVATIVYALTSACAAAAPVTVRGSSALARTAFAIVSILLMKIAADHSHGKGSRLPDEEDTSPAHLETIEHAHQSVEALKTRG